ncbi:MAG TPA: hypothetical protein VNK48_03295 [Xanthobacteraceae bacterium]|nr:hypothetical protein [Xanthobacteraceae bacterium]
MDRNIGQHQATGKRRKNRRPRRRNAESSEDPRSDLAHRFPPARQHDATAMAP